LQTVHIVIRIHFQPSTLTHDTGIRRTKYTGLSLGIYYFLFGFVVFSQTLN